MNYDHSTQTTASLNLLNMDSSLLDQNTVSIISSPNKKFYYMAALDSNDLEHFGVTRELKLHDNALGHHSNDMVNGWHLHNNEEVSSDNFTGMTYYESNEKTPNYGRNYFCYPVSSELLAINTQKSSDISNSCGNLATKPNDPFPRLPMATSSEAVLQVDVADHNRIVSSEDMSHSEAHSRNDAVNTLSLAELSNPSDVQQALEGRYNPGHAKTKRKPRKSVKKSKSLYNNSYNSLKNCGQRLNSATETAKQNNVQMKSEISSEDVISNCVSVQPCGSHLSSLPTLCHYVNTGENSRSEVSDGKGDPGSSGSEGDVLTSGVTSTGHESTAIDQTWDGYQVPLYAAISDDSSEEKLDATYLQGEWQPLTDEFMDFSDFANDCSSHSQHEASERDSDSDAEELLHLINESSDALRLTRSSLSQLKLNDGSLQSSHHREPLATCSTNITCLRDLIDIVSQKDWTHAEVNQLSDLLKQWENVESEFLRLTVRKDLSISHPDVILDVSPNALPVSPVSQKTNNSSSEIDMTLMESTSSPSCYLKCYNKSFSNRFDEFSWNVNKLLKGTSPLHQAMLTPIQILLFIILFLIFFYFVALNNHWTDMVAIKFDPQLRYVIGPPPL